MKHLAQKIWNKDSRKAMYLLLGCLIILISISSNLSAQSTESDYLQNDLSTHEFDRKNWKQTIQDLDYSGLPPAPKAKKKNKSSSSESRRRRPRSSGSSFSEINLSYLFKGFAIVAGIALLSWIIISLLGGIGPTNKRVHISNISLENIEDHIHETELEGFIRQAVAEGNYPLAVRLYYLAIIKELSIKKLITWKRDKTNGEYVRETRRTDFHKDFQALTLVFERIWYGGKTIEHADYQAIEPKFKTLVERIQRS